MIMTRPPDYAGMFFLSLLAVGITIVAMPLFCIFAPDLFDFAYALFLKLKHQIFF